MIHPDQTTATFGEIADEIAKSSRSSGVRESVLLDLCHCALTGLISPGNLGWNVEASVQLLSDDLRPKVKITHLPAGSVVQPASGPSIPDGTILLDERQSSFLEVTPEIIVGNLAGSMSSLGQIARDLLEEHGPNAALKLAEYLKLHGLPDKGDYGRPLIECLALSKGGGREFCVQAGWAPPRWAAAPVVAPEHCAEAAAAGTLAPVEEVPTAPPVVDGRQTSTKSRRMNVRTRRYQPAVNWAVEQLINVGRWTGNQDRKCELVRSAVARDSRHGGVTLPKDRQGLWPAIERAEEAICKKPATK